MRRATELAALVGAASVDEALALAAEAGRFAEGDLESILDHRRLMGDRRSERLGAGRRRRRSSPAPAPGSSSGDEQTPTIPIEIDPPHPRRGS